MRSGDLDQKIKLLKAVEINKQGSLSRQYIPIDDVWCKIISERGNETFESARQNARATIKILMRFRDDVDATWRIQWDGLNYEAIYVDKSLRRNGELWVTARTLMEKVQ